MFISDFFSPRLPILKLNAYVLILFSIYFSSSEKLNYFSIMKMNFCSFSLSPSLSSYHIRKKAFQTLRKTCLSSKGVHTDAEQLQELQLGSEPPVEYQIGRIFTYDTEKYDFLGVIRDILDKFISETNVRIVFVSKTDICFFFLMHCIR
jgi:hypothetical protein